MGDDSIISRLNEEISGADTVDYEPDLADEPEDDTVWIPYTLGAILLLVAVGLIGLFFILYF